MVKKVVDKFKTKNWYAVMAPEMFEGKPLGEIMAGEEETLINRIVTVSLGELTGSYDQLSSYTNLKFRISEVKGKTAYTRLIGHELVPGYVKSLVRRHHSLVTYVEDVVTKDNVALRIKAMVITGNRVSGIGKVNLRRRMAEELKAITKKEDFSTLEQEIIFGKMAGKVAKALKTLYPIYRVEVYKTEIKEKFS